MEVKMVKQFKNADRQLREYAKALVWVSDEMNKEENRYSWKGELIKDEYNKLVMEIVNGGHDVETLIIYMDEYRKMSVADYQRIYYREEE